MATIPVDVTTLTAEQRAGFDQILASVRDFQKSGAISHTALHNVIEQNAKELPNEVLVTAHALMWAEYDKDNTLTLLRAVLSALSIEHYRRLVEALADMPTHALLAVWEKNTADEAALDPVQLERNPASAYERVLGDRVVEKLGNPAGNDALDKMIDDFPEGPADEDLADRLRRYKAHEIAAYRALLAA